MSDHFLITNKDYNESLSNIIPLIESEVLSWAKGSRPDASRLTEELREKFLIDQSYATKSKYFAYLRRLLELKLEALSEPPHNDLRDALRIEKLTIPNHISCSQIGTFKSCEKKWYLRYAQGIKFPKTAALHFGTSVDETLNYYFDNKIKKIKTKEDDLINKFNEIFDTKEEIDWGNTSKDRLRNNAPLIIKAYLEAFDDVTNPKEVQKEVKISLSGNGYLTGAIDILEENAIIDTKTAKSPWKEGREKEELQSKAYSLWFYEEYGRPPDEFRYHIVSKESGLEGEHSEPRTQLLVIQPKVYELVKFKSFIQNIWDDIHKKIKIGKTAFKAEAEKPFPSPLCCKEYCEYAKICEKDGLKISNRWDKKNKKHIYD